MSSWRVGTAASLLDTAGVKLWTEVANQPFWVDFPRELVEDLRRRLDAIRWPETGFDAHWERGMDQATLREQGEYWRHAYDWFAVQDELENRNSHRSVEPPDVDKLANYQRQPRAQPSAQINQFSSGIADIRQPTEIRHVLLGSELPVGARVTLAGSGVGRALLLGLRAYARCSLRASA
jgi:hypothetical protein